MASNLSIPDFLEDSLARFRHYRSETFAESLFNNLKIVRPDVFNKVYIEHTELTGYNPKGWNEFFWTLQKHWYG